MAHYKLRQTGSRLQSDVDLTENLQNEFSESSTYPKDAIVIYDAKLWKCHTAVVAAGAWTGTTNWTQIHLENLGGADNPMRAVGDLIVGGSEGAPTRFPKGSSGQFLCMNDAGTNIEWKTIPLAHDAEF